MASAELVQHLGRSLHFADSKLCPLCERSGATGVVCLGAASLCAVQRVSRCSSSSVFLGFSCNLRSGCHFYGSYELVDDGDFVANGLLVPTDYLTHLAMTSWEVWHQTIPDGTILPATNMAKLFSPCVELPSPTQRCGYLGATLPFKNWFDTGFPSPLEMPAFRLIKGEALS